VVSADIIKILDLVNSDNPVLARESLFHSIEDGPYFWQLDTTDSILSLSGWEERVVVVV
jgi:hypothetical protein